MKMKKIIAGLSAMALASSMFVSGVSAAQSLNGTAELSGADIQVTVSSGIDFTSATGAVVTGSIKMTDSNGTSTGGTLTLASSGATTVTFATGATLAGNDNYFVSFRTVGTDETENTTDDVIVTAMLYLDNANEVKVTAFVEPILTMDMDNSEIAFGTLDVNTLKTATGEIAISTNAVGGATLFAQSANTGSMIDTNTNETIKAASGTVVMSGSTSDASYGYGIRIKSTASGTNIGGYTSYELAAQGEYAGATDVFGPMSETATAIALSTDGGSNGATVEIEYGVRISALQPAGNYTDTVTYTVTGNF